VNYYSHHIGDFDRATRHLSRLERSVYRDLLDVYYDTEAPLASDVASLCRKIIARTSEEATAVEQVLNEFFIETPAGWYHDRCEEELEAYRTSTSQKSAAGKASAAKRAAKRQQALNETATPIQRKSNARSTPVEMPLPSRGTALQLTNNQEPITINHKPDTSTASPSGDDVRQCPAGALVDAYHELMPNNPRVKVLSDARKSAIKARWIEASKLSCEPFGYATKSAGLAAWREFFGICAESKFLTGLSPPMPGKPAFVADIDFIFSPSGFAKTLENKYHRDTP
jgi:uncharacterized protein YdaU (DUF1376 family)